MSEFDAETLRKFPPLSELEKEMFHSLMTLIVEGEQLGVRVGMARCRLSGMPVAALVVSEYENEEQITPIAVLVSADLFDLLEPMPGAEIGGTR